MMMRTLFRWVGPFWNIFLTRWDPLFKTNVTALKLASVADWFSAGDFPQGTTVAE